MPHNATPVAHSCTPDTATALPLAELAKKVVDDVLKGLENRLLAQHQATATATSRCVTSVIQRINACEMSTITIPS
jgi:hypothetical protein